jgi:acetoin utilization deacetylase AcuC-like enzyme
MGFCLFNNIGVATAALRARGERVAIVDWDVHHGNGTQHLFGDEPDVLYVSLHEFPGYPGTGWVDEVGRGEATGTVVNLPMPTGSVGSDYRHAVTRVVAPVVTQFGADWLLLSAGYDAHRADPLAGIRLEADDYGWMASRLAGIVSPDRTVYLLEGGYDLEAVTASVTATLPGALREGGEPSVADERPPAAPAERNIELAVEALDGRWDLV